MTLHQLLILRTVIEKGNYVRAAESLRISQPAISSQIKALEKELGCTLLRRRPGSGKVEPTEAGEVAYQAALKLFEGLEELSRKLEALNRERRPQYRLVRLVCDIPTGIYILPRLVSEFRQRFRDVAITVTATNFRDLPATLHRDAFDVALVPEGVDAPTAIDQFTFLQPLAAVANPGLPQPSAPTDWSLLPLVLPPRNTVVRAAVEPYFKKVGIQPNVVLELNHPEAVKKAVKDNPVAAITHRASVQEDLETAVLSELEPPQPLPLLTYKVARNRTSLSEPVETLVLFLQERLVGAESAPAG